MLDGIECKDRITYLIYCNKEWNIYMTLIFSFPNAKAYYSISAERYVCLIPHCTLEESGSSSNSLTGYSSTCVKFSLRYLSLITETCATVLRKTEDNLLFSKTLMRHFSTINPVTLCFCIVDRLTVYDLLLKTSSCLCVVKVEIEHLIMVLPKLCLTIFTKKIY